MGKHNKFTPGFVMYLFIVVLWAIAWTPAQAAALPGAGDDPPPTPLPQDEQGQPVEPLPQPVAPEGNSQVGAVPAPAPDEALLLDLAGGFPEAVGAGEISIGNSHACLRTAAGGVKCWGWNNYGQLGDNTTTERHSPVDVVGLGSGVSAIAAGAYHTCALMTATGGVKCWGQNSTGQLGDNTTTERHTPVDVDGLNSGVIGISAGNAHTCAVLSSGAIKCWGFNGRGQLGNGTTTNSLLPVSVLITPGGAELSGGLAVAAGAYHTCAYTSFWAIKCWGWNGNGQLGDGTKINRSTPINVDGLSSNANAVDAGEYHSCAVTSTGGAKCWGSNSMGKLGDGTTTDHLTPVNVSGLTSGVSSLSIGRSHTCVRTSSGAAKCWGSNLAGILGSGAPYSTMHYSTTPVDVSGLSSGVSSVAGGNSNTCAVISGGVAKCWGHNYEGETGDGTTVSPRLTPVGVIGFSPPVAPTPQYPNTTVYSTCPLFRWTQLSTATGYNLYVYTSANTKIYSSPVTPTCDGTACRFNPGITIPVGDYKWATRASNDFGASPTSTWLNFSVALPLPPTPSTPNGAIIVANPTFTWSKSGGATGYKLYVYTAANVKVFAGSVAASCGSSTCTYASSLGLAHGSYKWALKAGNANGYGATSNWLNFTY